MYFKCLIKYLLTYVPFKNLILEPFHSEYYIIWDIILKDLLSNYERSWLIMCLKCCNFFSYYIHIIFLVYMLYLDLKKKLVWIYSSIYSLSPKWTQDLRPWHIHMLLPIIKICEKNSLFWDHGTFLKMVHYWVLIKIPSEMIFWFFFTKNSKLTPHPKNIYIYNNLFPHKKIRKWNE